MVSVIDSLITVVDLIAEEREMMLEGTASAVCLFLCLNFDLIEVFSFVGICRRYSEFVMRSIGQCLITVSVKSQIGIDRITLDRDVGKGDRTVFSLFGLFHELIPFFRITQFAVDTDRDLILFRESLRKALQIGDRIKCRFRCLHCIRFLYGLLFFHAASRRKQKHGNER